MKSEQITAAGYLLSTHESNLNYFLNFIRFSQGGINEANYCQKGNGTFKSFLNDYAVARNTKNEFTPKLLNHAFEWYQAGQTKEVDKFTQFIRDEGLTDGDMATSLASKIMYLMNPWEVLPIDSRVRKGINLRPNVYADYIAKVEEFKKKHEMDIHQSLEKIAWMLDIIESGFVGQINNLEKIRENRFVDKWLWVKGGK